MLSLLLPSHLVMGSGLRPGRKTLQYACGKQEQVSLLLLHLKGTASLYVVSPDGEQLASGSNNTTVRIWDSRTGVLVAGPIKHSTWVTSVTFSPNGEWIVSGCDDSNVYVWNLRTGAQIGVLEGHSGYVLSISFSPNGDRIVSGSEDRTLRVWNVHTKGEVAVLGEGFTARVQSVGVGNPIMLPSSQILGVPLLFEGHNSSVRCAAFSPDGERIVSGSQDKTVRMWGSKTGALLAEPIQHDDMIDSVAFSSDGEWIVSGSGETVQV
ncbi:WD40 repeat-like protein [Mycena venus]|uniref:WD40 repeat-like protein n=1 Tax=Mycena venus TaxID=2733690 RepID=A0A8H7D873_9AGAR|nr:WD40 repeat-like protein [Mycena venus]